MLVHQGDLYATGSFGPNQLVARWNPISQTWEPLGVFPPNTGMTALTVHNGQLVAGGIGGIETTASVFRWNGTAWLPVGQHLGFSLVQAWRCMTAN